MSQNFARNPFITSEEPNVENMMNYILSTKSHKESILGQRIHFGQKNPFCQRIHFGPKSHKESIYDV